MFKYFVMKISVSIYPQKMISGFSIIIVAALFFTGCKKDYLDEPKPTDKVSTLDVFKSVEGVRAYFNGLYRNFRLQWQSLDASAGGNDDTYSFVSINATRAA